MKLQGGGGNKKKIYNASCIIICYITNSTKNVSRHVLSDKDFWQENRSQTAQMTKKKATRIVKPIHSSVSLRKRPTKNRARRQRSKEHPTPRIVWFNQTVRANINCIYYYSIKKLFFFLFFSKNTNIGPRVFVRLDKQIMIVITNQ